MGYTLDACRYNPAKSRKGIPQADRGEQLRYINDRTRYFSDRFALRGVKDTQFVEIADDIKTKKGHDTPCF